MCPFSSNPYKETTLIHQSSESHSEPLSFVTHLCNTFNWQIKEVKNYRARPHAATPGLVDRY